MPVGLNLHFWSKFQSEKRRELKAHESEILTKLNICIEDLLARGYNQKSNKFDVDSKELEKSTEVCKTNLRLYNLYNNDIGLDNANRENLLSVIVKECQPKNIKP